MPASPVATPQPGHISQLLTGLPWAMGQRQSQHKVCYKLNFSHSQTRWHTELYTCVHLHTHTQTHTQTHLHPTNHTLNKFLCCASKLARILKNATIFCAAKPLAVSCPTPAHPLPHPLVSPAATRLSWNIVAGFADCRCKKDYAHGELLQFMKVN